MGTAPSPVRPLDPNKARTLLQKIEDYRKKPSPKSCGDAIDYFMDGCDGADRCDGRKLNRGLLNPARRNPPTDKAVQVKYLNAIGEHVAPYAPGSPSFSALKL
ncbi:MAG: hypothetical protein EB059_01270 [Alphaproteobacteria bacterium]|nr:hypothetical protein [Alphaproteobacteria bacterium]